MQERGFKRGKSFKILEIQNGVDSSIIIILLPIGPGNYKKKKNPEYK